MTPNDPVPDASYYMTVMRTQEVIDRWWAQLQARSTCMEMQMPGFVEESWSKN